MAGFMNRAINNFVTTRMLGSESTDETPASTLAPAPPLPHASNINHSNNNNNNNASASGTTAAHHQQRQQSKLSAMVVCCDGLNVGSDTEGVKDSYVILSLGSKKQRTQVATKSASPTFNQDFYFDLDNLSPNDNLTVMVYTFDSFHTDIFLGGVQIKLGDLKLDGLTHSYPLRNRLEGSKWADSKHAVKSVTGSIQLKFERMSDLDATRSQSALDALASGDDTRVDLASELAGVGSVGAVGLLVRSAMALLWNLAPLFQMRYYLTHIVWWDNPFTTLIFIFTFAFIIYNEYLVSGALFGLGVYLIVKWLPQIMHKSPGPYTAPTIFSRTELLRNVQHMRKEYKIPKTKTSTINDDIKGAVKSVNSVTTGVQSAREFENFDKPPIRVGAVIGLFVLALVCMFVPVLTIVAYALKYAILIGVPALVFIGGFKHHYPDYEGAALLNRMTFLPLSSRKAIAKTLKLPADSVKQKSKNKQDLFLYEASGDFQSTYNFPETELLLDSADCNVVKRDGSFDSTLFVSLNFISFLKQSIHFNQINQIKMEGPHSAIVALQNNEKLQFLTQSATILPLMQRRWEEINTQQQSHLQSQSLSQAHSQTHAMFLSPLDWEVLSGDAQIEEFLPTRHVYKNDTDNHLFYVQQGEVLIGVHDKLWKPVGVGEPFAYHALIGTRRIYQSAVTTTKATIFAIPLKSVTRTLLRDAGLGYRFFRDILFRVSQDLRLLRDITHVNAVIPHKKLIHRAKHHLNIEDKVQPVVDCEAVWLRDKPHNNLSGRLQLFNSTQDSTALHKYGVMLFASSFFGYEVMVHLTSNHIIDVRVPQSDESSAESSAELQIDSYDGTFYFSLKSSKIVETIEHVLQWFEQHKLNLFKANTKHPRPTTTQAITITRDTENEFVDPLLIMSADDWEMVASVAEPMVFQANDKIVDYNSLNSCLYWLVRGRVIVECVERKRRRILPSETIFGEESFAQKMQSTELIVAEKKSVVYCLSRSMVERLPQSTQAKFYRWVAKSVWAHVENLFNVDGDVKFNESSVLLSDALEQQQHQTMSQSLQHQSQMTTVLGSLISFNEWQDLFHRGGDSKNYSKNSVIVADNAINNNLYYLVDGTVNVQKTDANGRSFTLGRQGVGFLFGEVSLLLGTATTTRIVANSNDVSVLTLPQYKLLQLMSIGADAPIATRFYHWLAKSLAERLMLASDSKVNQVSRASTTTSATSIMSGGGAASMSNENNAYHEKLLLEQSCTLRKRVGVRGTFSLFENSMMFVSRLFGFPYKVVIPFAQIMEIRKESTARFASLTVLLRLRFGLPSMHRHSNTDTYRFDFDQKYSNVVDSIHNLVISRMMKKEEVAPYTPTTTTSSTGALASNTGTSLETSTPTTAPITAATAAVSSSLTQPQMSVIDWNTILNGCSYSNFGRDDVVFRLGSENDCLYQVEHGRVRLERVLDSGERQVVAYLTVGEIFGERGFLGLGEEEIEAVADSRSTHLLLLPRGCAPLVDDSFSTRFFCYLCVQMVQRTLLNQ